LPKFVHIYLYHLSYFSFRLDLVLIFLLYHWRRFRKYQSKICIWKWHWCGCSLYFSSNLPWPASYLVQLPGKLTSCYCGWTLSSTNLGNSTRTTSRLSRMSIRKSLCMTTGSPWSLPCDSLISGSSPWCSSLLCKFCNEECLFYCMRPPTCVPRSNISLLNIILL